jgi:endo-beta-N-acetylglucosaminidase D
VQIIKEFPITTFQISKDSYGKGTIWVNSCNNCILRVNNVNFVNQFDKFNQIDITCESNKTTVLFDEIFEENLELRNLLILLTNNIINEFSDVDNYKFQHVNYDVVNEIMALLRRKINKHDFNT